MVKTTTTINGRLTPKSDAKISVFDNSLQYAEGLFEMLLAVDDRPIFLQDHLRRLYRGSKVIGLKIPATRTQLRQWMVKTLRAHPARIKKLRLTITAGESARWFGKPGKPQIILSAGPHEMPLKPFRLLVSDFRIHQNSALHKVKTLSYALHAAALRQAHRHKFDDAILLNEHNEVAEVTSANLFWIRRGKVYTPPLSAGCLEGITRRIVFRECQRLNLPVAERRTGLDDLSAADEVFLSSSTKLVIAVSKIRNAGDLCTIPTGPIGERLFLHFRKLVGID